MVNMKQKISHMFYLHIKVNCRAVQWQRQRQCIGSVMQWQCSSDSAVQCSGSCSAEQCSALVVQSSTDQCSAVQCSGREEQCSAGAGQRSAVQWQCSAVAVHIIAVQCRAGKGESVIMLLGPLSLHIDQSTPPPPLSLHIHQRLFGKYIQHIFRTSQFCFVVIFIELLINGTPVTKKIILK